MGYAILWAGMLAGLLLLFAFLIAVASHSDKPFVREALPVAIVFFWLPLLAAAISAWFLVNPRWLFWYMLSLALACTIGGSIIGRKGIRRPPLEQESTERFGLRKIRRYLARRVFQAQAPDWPRLKLGISSLIVIALTVATYLYMDHNALEELARIAKETTAQVQEIQQILPVRVPDAQNARQVYDQASKSLDMKKDLPKWLQSTPADVSMQELAAFIGKHRDTRDLLYKAASMPHWRYDVDMAKPFFEWPLPPHFSRYKDLAYFLYHSACLKANAGDAGGALKDLAVIETMSNHLRTYPLLLPTMISYGVDDIRVRGVEHVCSHLQDGALKRHSQVKVHPTDLGTIFQVLRFESVGMVQTLSVAVAIRTDKQPAYANIMESLYRVFLMQSDIKTLQKISTIMARPVKTYDEYSLNVEETEKVVKNEGGMVVAINKPGMLLYTFRAMKHEASQGLADLALAMTSYKAAKGRYPEKIEELIPDYIDRIPTDPFDGKPLKMKPLKGGLELYSTASHPIFGPWDGTKAPINFYLGKEAYEEFRVKPKPEKNFKAE